jgi:hypothetical protein
VDPEEITVKLCQTFKINVNIIDVSGLQGFDFCLSYDSSILNCSEVEEGPFMASFGSTIVAYKEIDDNYKPSVGRVWFALAILGDAFADGSGTLATVTFNATAPGECVLDLHSILPLKPDEVKLCTCGPEPIPNIAVDGYIVVSSDVCDPPPADPPDPPVDPPPADPPDPPVDPPPADPPDPPNPDLNGDGIVNVKDLVIVAMAYGTSTGEARFDASADLNQDGSVNVADLYIIGQDFGHHV